MEGAFMDETKTEFCLSCGHKISGDDQFCNNCGSPLKEIKLEEQPKEELVQTKVISSNDVVVQRTDAGLQQKVIKVKKKVLGRNAIILTAFATSFFVVPCYFANIVGYPFALAAIIVGIIALTKDQQKTLAIISIVLSILFIILSVLARTVWDMGW